MAAVAMTFTACDTKKPEATPDPTPQEEAVAEVAYADSLTAALEAKDAGKIEQFLTEIQEKVNGAEAAKYKDQLVKVQEWLKANAETVKGVVGDKFAAIVDPVANFDLSKIAGDAVEGAKDAVEGAAGEAVEGAKDAVDGAKDAAKDAVDGAKDAAKDAVDGAKDAAKEAGDKVKDAAKDAKEGAKDAVKGAIDKL